VITALRRSCQVCNSTTCDFQAGITAYCGDGILQIVDGEQCDDGNTVSGDGCSSSCVLEPGYTCTVNQSCKACSSGLYGLNCVQGCQCQNGASCGAQNGLCTCNPPWLGTYCNVLPNPSGTEVSGTFDIVINTNPPMNLTGAVVSTITYFGIFLLPFTILGSRC